MRVAARCHSAQAAPEQSLQPLRELSHIALKGHRLVEESIGRIIARHCRAASVLDDVRMTFYLKTKLARALVGDLHDAVIWSLVWRLYLIYNDVAYKVESLRVRRLMKNLVEEKARWAGESLLAIANDNQLLASVADSIQYVLGALAAIEMQVWGNAVVHFRPKGDI